MMSKLFLCTRKWILCFFAGAVLSSLLPSAEAKRQKKKMTLIEVFAFVEAFKKDIKKACQENDEQLFTTAIDRFLIYFGDAKQLQYFYSLVRKWSEWETSEERLGYLTRVQGWMDAVTLLHRLLGNLPEKSCKETALKAEVFLEKVHKATKKLQMARCPHHAAAEWKELQQSRYRAMDEFSAKEIRKVAEKLYKEREVLRELKELI